jgi:hypothetical protein
MSDFSKDISVVVLPSYISKALESDGTRLTELAAIATNVTGRWDDMNGEEVSINILDKIKDTLSLYDMNTLVIANTAVLKYIAGTTAADMGGLSWVIDNKINDYLYSKGANNTTDNSGFMDLINDLRLTNTNSMSELKNNGYEFMMADRTIFVILHEGFSNIVIDGDKVNKEKLLLELVNYMFKSFGEDIVHRTRIFKQYLKTVQK